MAQVEVRDRTIWTKHVHGDADLVRSLENLPEGQPVTLSVGGKVGTWVKMRDQPGGKPTPGLKPVGEVQAHWKHLFENRRGAVVEIAMAANDHTEWASASDVEREAAWRAFKALSQAGWRSQVSEGDRDELHER